MSCFTPLSAWKSKFLVPSSGKAKIIFRPPSGSGFEYIQLPCGQCIGCREDRAKSWAVRCMHEMRLHRENCFITLTFDDEFLPANGSLVKRDFQLFMKRLRKAFPNQVIRYLHVGEYGEKYGRPHHHAILFGIDFADKILLETGKNLPIYSSVTLSKLWKFGFSTVGAADFDSACYVSRYCLKKLTGKAATAYGDLLPEYNTMSRGGRKGHGIGHDWYLQYGSNECHIDDFIRISGDFKVRPPKYYDKLFELTSPQDYAIRKEVRVKRAKECVDNTPDRLRDRHAVAKAKLRLRKRSFENE